MEIFKVFIIMLIGVLLMPALASGIAVVLNDSNVTGTPAYAVIGTILTIYAVALLYGGAKGAGLV